MFEEFPVEIAPDERAVAFVGRCHAEVSDVDLVGELVKNRPEAHRLAVQRFGPLVRGFLRRSLGPANDIDDVQQEVFWCLFRRIGTLRDPLSLRPFVMAIAFRIVLRERRRRRKLAQLTLEPELVRIAPATKRDDAAGSYALKRLGKLVHRLHERERSTFILRFVEGMTVTEIADALALSEATTRRSFKRAWLLVSKWAGRDPFLSDYFGVGYSLSEVG